jgi:peptidoglycan/xylan/chitin deacetylase (PgdA/CDA1 family)
LQSWGTDVSCKRTLWVLPVLIGSAVLLAACGSTQRLYLGSDEMAVKAEQISVGEIQEYVLKATAGQILAVDVVSPEGNVYLAVSGRDGDHPLIPASSKIARWSGVVPVTEKYLIQVIGSRVDTEYVMVVSLLPQVTVAEDPHAHFAGLYRLKAPTASALHDVSLFLSTGQSAILVGTSGVQTVAPFVMQGTWHAEGETATVELTEQDGEPFVAPETFRIEWRDGLLTVKGHSDQSWRTVGMQFTPTSGDSHSMVRELHQRLAAAGFLDIGNPGMASELYTESTRRAVAAFQDASGLAPHGVADAATLAALEIALLPERTSTGAPIVYLTFDDGPNGAYTPQILDLLARYNAQATFFVLGEQALSFPELIRAEAAAGHYVANHGFAHHDFGSMSRTELNREIQKTERLLREIAGDLFAWDGDVHFLRPPYGLTNEDTMEHAAESGYVVVIWDVDSQDWQLPGTAQIVSAVLDHVRPGDIVLMHDGGGDRTQTILALEIILRELSGQGYTFRSLFGHGVEGAGSWE